MPFDLSTAISVREREDGLLEKDTFDLTSARPVEEVLSAVPPEEQKYRPPLTEREKAQAVVELSYQESGKKVPAMTKLDWMLSSQQTQATMDLAATTSITGGLNLAVQTVRGLANTKDPSSMMEKLFKSIVYPESTPRLYKKLPGTKELPRWAEITASIADDIASYGIAALTKGTLRATLLAKDIERKIDKAATAFAKEQSKSMLPTGSVTKEETINRLKAGYREAALEKLTATEAELVASETAIGAGQPAGPSQLQTYANKRSLLGLIIEDLKHTGQSGQLRLPKVGQSVGFKSAEGVLMGKILKVTGKVAEIELTAQPGRIIVATLSQLSLPEVDPEIKRVGENLLKNNPGITQKDAEAMAKDVIENRKFTQPTGEGKVDKWSYGAEPAAAIPGEPIAFYDVKGNNFDMAKAQIIYDEASNNEPLGYKVVLQNGQELANPKSDKIGGSPYFETMEEAQKFAEQKLSTPTGQKPPQESPNLRMSMTENGLYGVYNNETGKLIQEFSDEKRAWDLIDSMKPKLTEEQIKIQEEKLVESANNVMSARDVERMLKKLYPLAKELHPDNASLDESFSDFVKRSPEYLAMAAENESMIYHEFLSDIDFDNTDASLEDVIKVYQEGKLGNKSLREPLRISKVPLKGESIFSGAIGEPKEPLILSESEAKALYEKTKIRSKKSNEKELLEAKKNLFHAYNSDKGLAKKIGIKESELTSFLRNKVGIKKSAIAKQDSLNQGVDNAYQWVGFTNVSWINKSSISEKDLLKYVKDVIVSKDASAWNSNKEWFSRMITTPLLGFDTRLLYKDLLFILGKCKSKTALGEYSPQNNAITISDLSLHTVAHETLHYLDHKFARELGVDTALSEGSINFEYLQKLHKLSNQHIEWAKKYLEFVKDLLKGSEVGYSRERAEYVQSPKEVLARFGAKFIEWVEKEAGGYSVTNGSYYSDTFSERQFNNFVHLLQEKAYIDAKFGVKDLVKSKGESIAVPELPVEPPLPPKEQSLETKPPEPPIETPPQTPIPPKTPIVPPEPPPEPSIPFEGDSVKRVIQAIKEAKPIRAEQEALMRIERGKRIAKAKAIGEKIGGEAGYYARLGSLKGEMPKAQFETLKGKITQSDINNLFDMISKSDLNEWDKLPAMSGLAKLFGEFGGTVPTEGELQVLNKVFGKEFTDALLENRTLMQKFMEASEQLLNIPRSVMSSFDLSAPLRQGAFFIARPEFGPAFKEMFKFFGSDKALNSLMQDIQTRPTYELMREYNLALTDLDTGLSNREEKFMSNWAEKIPLAGIGIRASSRAYVGFLNKLRADVFDNLVNKAKGLGIETTDKFYSDLVEFINAATGRGKLTPKLEKAAVALNSIFFSPRLMASRIQLLNPVFYITKDPFVRKEALKSLFSSSGIWMSLLGLAALGGLIVGTDWRSSDFAKIKIGNTRIDFGAGFQQYLRMAGQLITGEYVSSVTGKVLTLGEGYKPLTRFDIILRQLENKESPVASFITSLLRQKTFMGEDVNVLNEIGQRFTPMVLGDLIDLAKTNPQLLPLGVLGLFGVGLQTYEDKQRSSSVRGSSTTKKRTSSTK